MSKTIPCIPFSLGVFANAVIRPIHQTAMEGIRWIQLVIPTAKIVLEVDVIHIRERHRQRRSLRRETQVHCFFLPIVFVVEKPEGFVLDDRPADVASKYLHAAFRVFLPLLFQEVVGRVQTIVLKEREYAAMNLIGSTLGDRVDDDTRCPTVFSAVLMCQHLEFRH